MVAPLIPLYRLVLEKGSSHNAEHYHIIAAFTLQGQCTEQVVSGVAGPAGLDEMPSGRDC